MQKSILTELIGSLDKKTYKYVRRWLASPIHNKREDVRALFAYYERQMGRGDLSKEAAFAAIYPDRPYDDALMRQVMYFLQRQIEQFLVYRHMMEDELYVGNNLLRIYRKRGLARAFKRKLGELKKRLASGRLQDRITHYRRYRVLQEEYNYQSEGVRFQDFNLQEVSDALEQYFLAEKLRLACIMISHERVRKSAYDKGLLADALRYMDRRQWDDLPAVSLYYYAYLALTEAGGHWFDRLLTEMERQRPHLPGDELREILLLALNFCIGKINEGQKQYYRPAFRLYRQGLSDGSFLVDGRLSRYTFINILFAALHEGETEWVESLVRDYGPLIESRFRESTINLAYIHLNYHRRAYKKAMQLIMETVFDDLLMGLSAKTILAKIYFELGEEDALESFLDSFLVFLRRKEVMAYHREIYKNFVLSLRHILRLAPQDAPARRKLRARIEALDAVMEKEWLLSKLEK